MATSQNKKRSIHIHFYIHTHTVQSSSVLPLCAVCTLPTTSFFVVAPQIQATVAYASLLDV